MNKIIDMTVQKLSDIHNHDFRYIPMYDKQLPSVQILSEIVDKIREIIFPGFFGNSLVTEHTIQYNMGVHCEKLYHLLYGQIYKVLTFEIHDTDFHASTGEKFAGENGTGERSTDEKLAGEKFTVERIAAEKTITLLDKLPEIKRLLSTDIKAIYNSDPAAKNYGEIIFCYPAIKALLNYRIAHELYLIDIPIIPRIITEMAHSETGIDIHPGATIGEYFSIDHGTGVVIGQTAIIGHHVRLYQGVTLGAKSFVMDDAGNPVDVPRHPVLEDNVTIYSNTSILGRITIGSGTVVGGNIWLTHSVLPNSKITQTKAVEDIFTDGLGI